MIVCVVLLARYMCCPALPSFSSTIVHTHRTHSPLYHPLTRALTHPVPSIAHGQVRSKKTMWEAARDWARLTTSWETMPFLKLDADEVSTQVHPFCVLCCEYAFI